MCTGTCGQKAGSMQEGMREKEQRGRGGELPYMVVEAAVSRSLSQKLEVHENRYSARASVQKAEAQKN